VRDVLNYASSEMFAANYETEKGEIVRAAVESIALASLHPCTKISVVVQVVRDDGALLAVCLNAACLALLNAGIQCKSVLSVRFA